MCTHCSMQKSMQYFDKSKLKINKPDIGYVRIRRINVTHLPTSVTDTSMLEKPRAKLT